MDVIVGYSSDTGEGFIPFDHKIRGMGLGIPALVLPIIAFIISRKDLSKGLGGMLIVAGVLNYSRWSSSYWKFKTQFMQVKLVEI